MAAVIDYDIESTSGVVYGLKKCFICLISNKNTNAVVLSVCKIVNVYTNNLSVWEILLPSGQGPALGNTYFQ